MKVFLDVSSVRKYEKGDRTFYFLNVRDNIYVEGVGYTGGISFFCDKDTYDALQDSDEIPTIKFTSEKNVKLVK